MRPRFAEILAAFIGATVLVAGPALAQTPDAGPPEGEEVVPPAPPPDDAASAPASDDPSLSERLRRLEERDAEREAELDAALARVAELERGAAAAPATPEPEPEPEAAPDGPTTRPLASMLTRYELRRGYEDLGAGNPGCFPGANDGDCVRYRARVGLEIGSLAVGDDVVASVRFLPQVTGFWSFGGSGGVSHPAVSLYEGHVDLAVGQALRFEVGRIVLNYGDQRVLGALGWHPAARSFDGGRLQITPDGADGIRVDALFTLLSEGGPGGFADADGYLYGVYAMLGSAIAPRVDLDVYALGLQQNDRVDPATGAQLGWSLRAHLGARFHTRVDVVDLRLEGGLQLGRAGRPAPADGVPIVAGHVDGEVAVLLLEDRLRIGALAFFASGDDPSSEPDEAYAQLFPTAHAFLGLTDVMGARTNAGGAALRFLATPIPELKLGLDLHVFARPEVAGVEEYAGTEADAQVVWLAGAGLRLRAMYGIFIPNPGQWGPGADTVHFFELELLYELR